MKTPIIDFIEEYKSEKPLRLHTPGHKGFAFFGHEADDITEIPGADELFSPTGIIAQSEDNASGLFGAPTYYSTEGSSLCVRAMVYMICRHLGRPAVILAQRNVHRSFITAAALTGADVVWIAPHEDDTVLSVTVTADDVEKQIERVRPDAVYLTTPDYLGKITDVTPIAEVCRRHGVYLLVDCAHGAYLHFLPKPSDPVTLGADLCCTSAHKTLPALTGAAYLHAPGFTPDEARSAMAAFASTSPSYLILQSLDGLNAYLSGYRRRLLRFLHRVGGLKDALIAEGFTLYGDEPLKLTLKTSASGLTGTDAAEFLRRRGIEAEYFDRDFITFMLTPEIGAYGCRLLLSALRELPRGEALPQTEDSFVLPERVMSIRDAFMAKKTTLPTKECIGRVAGDVCVSCPPAVSPVVCGERLDGKTVSYLIENGMDKCQVVT